MGIVSKKDHFSSLVSGEPMTLEEKWAEADKHLIFSRCGKCKHYHQDSNLITCEAFPEGIPDEIFFNEFIHDKPYPGDNGIMFKEKSKI